MENPLFKKRKTVKEFLKEHLVSILYTLIFHLLVLIIMMSFKVRGLKEDRELGVMLDFTHEELIEPEEEVVEVPASWMEQVYRARERASNQAVNTAKAEEFQEDISTDSYVKDLESELESQRDDEYLQERDRLNDIIAKGVFDEPEKKIEEKDETAEYKGPTTISYEFLEAPQGRLKAYFEIPVYRCEGGALVKVAVLVDRYGTVLSADIASVSAESGATCFRDAALNAALHSRFRPDMTAPEKQKAIITYTFISQ